MPTNQLAPPDMPWLAVRSPLGQPNGLGPPMLNYAAPPDPAAPTLGQGVAQTYQNVAQALPSWPSVEEQRQMLQPLPGWQGTAVDAAKQWAEGVMMGTTAPGDVPPPGIVAYHGSPADFNRFDDRFIGTGEGAQAYGRGHYFGGAEGVARSYRDQLAPVTQDAVQDALAHLKSSNGDFDAAIDANKAMWKDPSGKYAQQVEGILQNWKQNGFDPSATPPTGHMYEVNIGADPEHFLDWDKPLSEQSQHVQEALKPLGYQSLKDAFSIRPVENGHVIDYVDNSGQARTTSRVFPTQDAAERAARVSFDTFGRNPTGAEIVLHNPGIETQLHEAGIPGIRYLDAGSRNAGEGTHNYVVFDPATIEILRKYGLAGLIAGGGAAAAGTQQSPSQ